MSDAFELVDKIAGASKLIDRIGNWPAFHDAEIVELCLRAHGVSELKIRHVWGKSLDENARDFLAAFEIGENEDLALCDFNHQNVTLKMSITHAENL